MKYVERLLGETDYLKRIEKLERLEADREFCRHGLPHFLDTARIAWIRVLEQRTEGYASGGNQELLRDSNNPKEAYQGSASALEKEDIYLAALLHDLGRISQYEEGIPHHQAGGLVAEKLLGEIGYPKEKQERLVKAIEGHRGLTSGQQKAAWAEDNQDVAERKGSQDNKTLTGEPLGSLLRWADKKSRNCFFCKAQAECNWEQGKRNETIEY